MEQEDNTYVEIQLEELTPVTSPFDLMATIFTKKVSALRQTADQLLRLPADLRLHSMRLLGTALEEVLEAGRDLGRLIARMIPGSSSTTPERPRATPGPASDQFVGPALVPALNKLLASSRCPVVRGERSEP